MCCTHTKSESTGSPNLWKVFHTFHPTYTHWFVCYWKNLLFLDTEESIHGKVSTRYKEMSSYVKNKLQMCSGQTTSAKTSPNLWKIFTNSPMNTHFLSVTKNLYLFLTEQSIDGKLSTRFQDDKSLMVRTNYRCVQSRNISADVVQMLSGKCSFTNKKTLWVETCQDFLFSQQKMSCLDWTIWFMARFQLIWRCPLMLRTNYRCVQS